MTDVIAILLFGLACGVIGGCVVAWWSERRAEREWRDRMEIKEIKDLYRGIQ